MIPLILPDNFTRPRVCSTKGIVTYGSYLCNNDCRSVAALYTISLRMHTLRNSRLLSSWSAAFILLVISEQLICSLYSISRWCSLTTCTSSLYRPFSINRRTTLVSCFCVTGFNVNISTSSLHLGAYRAQLVQQHL